jgi:mannose-6-phosphate isomerase-like protein (cupin superfamily)
LELIIIFNNRTHQRNVYAAHQFPQHQTADFGPNPFTTDIVKAAKCNENFRTALWTGTRLQVTLMCIPPGSDVGLEVHPHTDQMLFVAEGCGLTMMGGSRDSVTYQQPVYEHSTILVPAGSWHNVVNTGNKPLKLFSVYAPPEHPHGTVHATKSAEHY